MTGPGCPGAEEDTRVAEAADWFARMKGPEGAGTQAEFDLWMQDERNAAAYRQMEAVWSLSGRANPRSRPPLTKEARRWWQVAAVAAAVAGGVSLATLLQLDSAPHRSPEVVSYGAPVGAIREVRLDDGSVVTLDTDSRIAVNLDGPRREVALLSGRARFAVAHDVSRPFVVLVGQRAVVATGTLFDVRIRQAEVEVTLIEGDVELEQLAHDGRPTRLGRLHPGERAVLKRGSAVTIERTAIGSMSWTGGIFTAEAMPLRELIAEANRYTATKILLADPSLGDLQVSGAFKLGAADALALQLTTALDLRVADTANGGITLTGR